MLLASDTQTILDHYTQKRQTQLQKEIEGLHTILTTICQSPMEQYFLLKVINEFDGPIYYHLSEKPYIAISIGHEIGGKTFTLVIFPQYKLTSNSAVYYVDFMFMLDVEYYEPTSFWFSAHSHYYIAVEIDGHEYHERTKTQAEKDKFRDREIRKIGFSVFRYTGSEIYRNTPSIIWQIIDLLRSERNDFARQGEPLASN